MQAVDDGFDGTIAWSWNFTNTASGDDILGVTDFSAVYGLTV